MLSYNRIYSAFKNLIGLRQTKDPCFPLLESDLLVSESGLYANDLAKNWLTSKNIYECIPDFQSFNYDVWDIATNYTIDTRIQYQGNVYKALTNNVGLQPDVNTSDWELLFKLPSLSTWLNELRDSAISELVNTVLLTNNKYNQSSTLTPSSITTILEGNIKERVLNYTENKFIGVASIPALRNDMQLQIRQIGVKFALAGTYKLYIFHSSQNQAIKTYDITIDVAEQNQFVWKNLVDSDGNICVLDYHSSIKNAGGTFFVGFFTDDLPASSKEFILNEYDETYFTRVNRFNNFFNFQIIKVNADDLDGTNIFDLGKVDYYNEYIPFNLDVVAFSDQSYQIISAKRMWAKALQYKLACKILEEMYNSPHLTRIANQAKRDLTVLLHGIESQNIKGLKAAEELAIKDLVKNYECADGFERRTMPKLNFY